MDRLGRREDRRINARQRYDHADQLAALDAALIRTFGHRITACMLLGGLVAVAILHRCLGRCVAGSKSRADGGKRHRKGNQAREKVPIHAVVLPLLPRFVNSRHCTL
jgi:hypothetical protein